MEIRPIITLHFFKLEGCDHCKQAEPYVTAFRQKYPLRVLVVPHNLTVNPRSNAKGYSPEGAPSFAVEIGGEVVDKRGGVMTLKELEKWIGKENL